MISMGGMMNGCDGVGYILAIKQQTSGNGASAGGGKSGKSGGG
jgi:hypothetical protein